VPDGGPTGGRRGPDGVLDGMPDGGPDWGPDRVLDGCQTGCPTMARWQGCHKGRFWRKITVWTSARVRIYPADVVLPADGFLPSADTVKTASVRTCPCPCGRWGASVRTPMSARKHFPPLPSPSLSSPLPPSPPLPLLPPSPLLSAWTRKKIKNKISFGSCCRFGKREKIYNLQFSVFGFRFSIPEIPQLRGRSHEKKVFSA
jgi:hypothetical protein